MKKPSEAKGKDGSGKGSGRASGGTPLVRVTLAERVYETLKERILDQRLKAGARLNIDALSRELEVSSSPIREALVRLESEHLIVSELYAGYSVAPHPTLAHLSDLLDYRILVEGHCARIGCERRDPEIIVLLKQALEKMSQVKTIGKRYREYQRFVQADGRFHQVLVDSARNEVISKTYTSLNALILQSRLYLNTPSDEMRLSEVLQEHAGIVAAFERGDGAAAEVAVRNHLEGGRRRLLT